MAEIKVGPLASMLQGDGTYGEYGGAFIPPVLEDKLSKLYDFFEQEVRKDDFQKEYIKLLKQYVGRPSPLYYAHRLSQHIGSRIYLKREDLTRKIHE